MSGIQEKLKRRIDSASELQTVVRAMKALAMGSIGPYIRAASSLEEYWHTVELAIKAALVHGSWPNTEDIMQGHILAIIFGSDQGMVGNFNGRLAEFSAEKMKNRQGIICWPVGGRIEQRLADYGLKCMKARIVPDTISGIMPLVSTMVENLVAELSSISEVWIFHNRLLSQARYEPHGHKLLPVSPQDIADQKNDRDGWPRRQIPEAIGGEQALIRSGFKEYIFVSLFKAAADSSASEYASRLAAMQRAERNIKDKLEDMQQRYHRVRQSAITAELMDITAGFEALR